MSDRELLEMALEALDNAVDHLPKPNSTNCANVAAALRARLAQPDLAKVGEVGVWGEPVAWMYDWDIYDPTNSGPDFSHEKPKDDKEWIPLYTHPQREWVGLTVETFKSIASKYSLNTEAGLEYFQEELEAKLKERNT